VCAAKDAAPDERGSMSEYSTGAAATDDGSMAAQAQEKVQAAAQKATGAAGGMVRGQVETRAAQAGTELRSVATALRRTTHSLHADGNEPAAKVSEALTDRIEAIAGYLGRTSGDRMLHDVEAFGRRRPWMMIGAGLTLGLAASRFLKASSSERYHSTATPQRLPVPSGRPAVPPAPTIPPPRAAGVVDPDERRVDAPPQTIGGAPVSGW
jgi:hypothetical protein